MEFEQLHQHRWDYFVRRIMVRYSILLFLFTSFTCRAQTADDKLTLIELAHKRSAALVTGDSVEMKEILHENFFYVNSYGEKKNRQKYIRNMFLQGDSKWIAQRIDSMDVKLIGPDAAILSFVVLDHFRYDGKEYKVYNRSTFVYWKKRKVWKCMSGHTTELAGEK